MPLFRRGQPPKALSAAIAGVKLGDRVLIAGTDDIRLAAALATQAGLSGRVVLIAPDDARAAARATAIEQAGAFVEPYVAPLDTPGLDAAAFDVAVVEDTLASMDDAVRARVIAALFTTLRPGGRLLWIERQPRRGLLGFGGAPAASEPARERELTEAGFRGARTLAAAQGRTYVEGIKAAATEN